jgi:prefoldin alpha subunit
MTDDTYAELQMFEYQIKQLQQILENVEAQLNEVKNTKENLEDFKKLQGNEEVLFPLANGIFAKGQLTDNSMLRMNVGNNVVVEKNVDEAIAIMNTQYTEIEQYRGELQKQLASLMKKIEGANVRVSEG